MPHISVTAGERPDYDEPAYDAGEVVVSEPEVEIPTPSPLLNLKERRQAQKAKLIKDIRIPRWENPELWLRFRPAEPTALERFLRKRARGKDNPDPGWGIDATLDIIVDACVAVYAKYPDDETEYSLKVNDAKGSLTRIDHEVARALGLEDVTTAAETARALFLAEGDINTVGNALLTWSNVAGSEADETF
jgi:hypothetical protein